MDVASIISNCSGIGEPVTRDVSLVERGQSVSIPAGCDVCIAQAAELWLTLSCPTNVDRFPNITVESYRWTDEDGKVLSELPTLLVQEPGAYTCRVDFGTAGVDTQTTTVGCTFCLWLSFLYYYDIRISITNADVPDVRLQYFRDGSMSSGCDR